MCKVPVPRPLTLLGGRCWQGLGVPPDLGLGQGVLPFTAGQHNVAAGVAQVDVGLTALPLAPQAQAQAAAVTALLQDKGNISNQH